jgi:hypothetical protein
MGAKSKQKGNRYERRCAKLLHEFTGVNFRKVPASGGFNKFGGQVVAEHAFSGDVICDRKDFLFSVEAKSQKVFSFVAMLKNPSKCAFTDWWKQCVDDAKKVSKFPMLIFKPDTTEDFVALTTEGYFCLGLVGVPCMHIDIYDGTDIPAPKILRWKTLVQETGPEKMFGE